MKPSFFLGIFIIFFFLTTGSFSGVGVCTGVILFIGGVITLIGFTDTEIPKARLTGLGLIEIGVFFLVLVFIQIFHSQLIPYNFLDQWYEATRATFEPVTKADRRGPGFNIISCIFWGISFIGGGVFFLNPPSLGKVWGGVKNQNSQDKRMVSIMDDSPKTPGTPYGLSKPPEGWNVDQAIWEIMNADTNLRALAQTNPDLIGKIQTTLDFYNPQGGVLSSWSRRLRGEGRTKLLEVLNKEQRLLIEQAVIFEQQVMDGRKKQVEFQMFLAKHAMDLLALKTQAEFNQQAFGKGMFAEHYSDVNKEEELRKIRERELEAKAKIERENEEARIRRNLESAKAYKMNEHAITDEYRRKMEKALIELEAIETRTDISEKTKASLKIAKENEAENLRRIITARERKAASDEESFL